MKKLLVVATTALLVMGSSCNKSESSLAVLTASHVNGVKPNQVNVSNISQQGKTVSWTASTPKGVYSCSLNGMNQQVIVAQK